MTEQAYRQRLWAWMAERTAEGWRMRPASAFPSTAEYLAWLARWQRMLYEAGFLASHWPSAYGGRDGSPLEPLILAEAQATFDAPRVLNGPAISITGPTLLAWGTESQKRAWLPRMLTAEDVWCIGFSEPGAGSDLASLSTRGELHGDHYLLSGQKVWTSYADFARWGLFLVRTEPGSERHRGLSLLVVDMSAPGITVRPIRQMTGEWEFCEVFLDGAPVPVENLVGPAGEGWRVVQTTLGHERGTLLAFETQIHLRKCVRRMGELARGGVQREEAVRSWVEVEVMRLLGLRTLAELRRAGADSPVASVLKLYGSELGQRIYDRMMAVQGPAASQMTGSPRAVDDGQWQYRLLLSRSYTIASGTSEIQRNIIAERLLGMPR